MSGPQRRQTPLYVAVAGLVLALALIIGWELDWGDGFSARPPALASPQPEAVPLALLKELAPAPLAAFAETAERPLLVPTRRPSPPAAAPEAKPRMQRGQFVLMGTTVAGARSFALLREANGNKQIRVAQGDTVKGLVVDKVEPSQVTLRLEEDTEILLLKTAVSANRPAGTAPGAGAGRTPTGQLVPPSPPAAVPSPLLPGATADIAPSGRGGERRGDRVRVPASGAEGMPRNPPPTIGAKPGTAP
ncbi:MAG: hypothetical protein F9K47_15320 [Burkholderiales bacterium]|nr:MAG: hypothetical protein F9K47_15320 [Burkholderiales bacterium]